MSSGQRNFFDRYARGEQQPQSTNNYVQPQQNVVRAPVVTSSTSNNSNFEARRSEVEGEKQAVLKYATESLVLASGSSDYSKISSLKDAILELKSNYFSTSGITVKGEKRDELDRRFLLIEHELDGLLRRRIEYSSKDYEGGSRTLDFTNLLNEKENQIVELEKKIQNLEERLRRTSARQVELENKIVALKAENLTLRDKTLTGDKLYNAMQREADLQKSIKELNTLKANFASAASIWKTQLSKFVSKYPSERAELDYEITNLLQRASVTAYSINGIETIEIHSEKTVEVPVQDSRTKHLIHLLATNLRNLSNKYPKLLTEIDTKLVEFFQQQLIDVIEVDQLDRVVQIVKFIPQVVRVENVYSYCSERSRKVEFHLRILIKALLEELEKIKIRYGAVLQIDQGVVGMINQEIMGVVSVDDILKVFRIVPKIVEVQRIIEKIVERIVEVPQVIPVERIVEKIIEVPKIQEIEKIIHVPVEIVKIVEIYRDRPVEVASLTEKIVEVPTLREKIVDRIVEVPKIVEVEKIVQKIVINTEVVTVQKPVHHVVTEPKEVIVYRDKIVPVEKIVERIVEVQVIVEKIVEKVIEIPKIVEVEKIVQKIIKVVEYQVVDKNKVVVNQVIKQVERIVQKIVIAQTVIEKIVQVPQIVEKIVQVTNTITQIKQVQVIREKLVPTIQIKQVQRINNVVVPLIKQVEKIVDRRVEVPIIQERIVSVPEIINRIVIERVQVPKIIQVEKYIDKIITVTKLVEVQRPVVHYIKDIQIVKAIVEKIVEVPRTVERIKEVKVRIQKIVEKMVEVPKVVEVQKIVEKIVVVPRVIEKIVEVPQIVQVIVEKVIEIERIRQVQVIVQKIVQVQKPVQVQVIKNVYIQIEKPIEKIVQKIIPVEKLVEKVSVIENIVEKIISVRNEVPKEIYVDKIVPKIVETQVFVQVERPVTLVVQIPVQVEKIVERAVAVPRIQEKIVQVPQIIEKIVQVAVQNTHVRTVEQIVQKIIEVRKPEIHTEDKIIIQERIKQVEKLREKIVQTKQTIVERIPVQQIIEKIVERVVQIPKIVQIQKIIEKMVEKHQIVELETILPQLVKVHEVVKEYIEKIVPIITRHEIIKQVEVEIQKIVQVQIKDTQLKPFETIKEKVVEVSKIVEVVNTKNYIENQVKVVDRFEQTQVPVYTTVEKIVQVPQILEKIVERIVVMPQVVEVLKYVHEICEVEELGVGLAVDVQVQQSRYRQVYGNTRKQMELLLIQLRKLRTQNPEFKLIIDLLEGFLVDFEKLASVQRIVGVDKERIVEKEINRPVLVPTKDSWTIRNELAMSLLVEKLVLEIKRIRKDNPNVNLKLDDDVLLVFFSELHDKQTFSISAEFNSNLKQYTQSAISKFTKMGGSWTSDHEIMLNTILEERFAMANLVKQANLEIQKVRVISDKRAAALREKENQFHQVSKQLSEFHKVIGQIYGTSEGSRLLGSSSSFTTLYKGVDSWIHSDYSVRLEEPMKILGEFVGSGNDWNRIQSVMREREREVQVLTRRLVEFEKSAVHKQHSSGDSDRLLSTLRSENESLRREVDRLKSSVSSTSSTQLHEYEVRLKTAQSRISELESQLRTAELQLKQLKDTKSSAASFTENAISSNQSNISGVGLTSSQYSSSSESSSKYVSGVGSTTAYQTPSYGTGIESHYKASTGTEGLSSSGVRQGYSTSYGTSGVTGTTSYGATRTGTTSYGTTGVTGTIGTTSYGTTGVTGTIGTTSYGTTGVTGTTTYGSSGLSGSGIGSSSGYSYQTKKY